MTAQTPDIEVARYALRTFRIDPRARALIPVVIDDPRAWENGVCVARCHRDHSPPANGCRCGVYGATSLGSLFAQYPLLASHIVAVIAAEGATIIGSSGLRTQAARVVAYWCGPSPGLAKARAVLAEQCPDAQAYNDCVAMLARYHLPFGLDQLGTQSGPGVVYTKTVMTAPPVTATSKMRRLGCVVGIPMAAAGLVHTAAARADLGSISWDAVATLDSTIRSGIVGTLLMLCAVLMVGVRTVSTLTNFAQGHHQIAPAGGQSLRAITGACIFFSLYAAWSKMEVPVVIGKAAVMALVGLAIPYMTVAVAAILTYIYDNGVRLFAQIGRVIAR